MPLKLKDPRPHKTPFFYIRGTHLGVGINQSAGTSDRRLAAKLLRQIERDIEGGKIRPFGMTFGQAALSYLQSGRSRQYLAPLIRHFGETQISAIDQTAVDNAASVLYPSRSPATLNRQVFTPLLAVINHADPEHTLKLRRPKVGAARTLFLDRKQAKALLGAMKPKLRRLATFLLYTGCRVGEACALRWETVNLKDGIAYIPQTKGGEPRAAHLPPLVVKDLGRIGPKVGRVFGYASRFSVEPRWRAAAARAGLPWATPHVLRHTWATWMRRYGGADGIDLVATGAWRNLASVNRYTHVTAREVAGRSAKLPRVD